MKIHARYIEHVKRDENYREEYKESIEGYKSDLKRLREPATKEAFIKKFKPMVM